MTYFPIPNPLPVTATAGSFALSGVLGSTQGTSPWVTTATVSGTAVVSGTVSATQGTSPWVVSAAAVGATQSGSWAISSTQGTSPWVVSAAAIGVTQGTSPWSIQDGVTAAVVSTAAPAGIYLMVDASAQGRLLDLLRLILAELKSIRLSNVAMACDGRLAKEQDFDPVEFISSSSDDFLN